MKASIAVWPLPAACGEPLGSAALRTEPADFFVEEIPSWQPDGSGEHDVLWVEKRDANTRWVADQLAAFAQVHARDVSYAGLKDRRAITRQWFSVHRPGRTIDWQAFSHRDITVLEHSAHSRKLRIGTLAGNRFRIVLRAVDVDPAVLRGRVQALAEAGVPNYFGPQRFGRDGDNLQLAAALAAGRRLSRAKRGFALSAARAFIFNAVLAARVQAGDWRHIRRGDVAMLDNSRSFFPVDETVDLEPLAVRAAEGDLHPSGPLWGRGALHSGGAIGDDEQAAASRWPDYVAACERGGAEMQRRALRVMPGELRHEYADRCLTLEFSLPAGSFATALINELVSTA